MPLTSSIVGTSWRTNSSVTWTTRVARSWAWAPAAKPQHVVTDSIDGIDGEADQNGIAVGKTGFVPDMGKSDGEFGCGRCREGRGHAQG
jgi:hypothetical protein